ncbi:hypothetical protein L208DRAFT_1375283 [Tricholoma matsutake]|nr:hypothetical protein L208DRAFT_1375283 [Tricholoma matsutake 945]
MHQQTMGHFCSKGPGLCSSTVQAPVQQPLDEREEDEEQAAGNLLYLAASEEGEEGQKLSKVSVLLIFNHVNFVTNLIPGGTWVDQKTPVFLLYAGLEYSPISRANNPGVACCLDAHFGKDVDLQRISPPSEIPRSQLMKAVDDWGEKHCSTALAKERMTTHRTPSRPERKLEARWFLGDSDFVDRIRAAKSFLLLFLGIHEYFLGGHKFISTPYRANYSSDPL